MRNTITIVTLVVAMVLGMCVGTATAQVRVSGKHGVTLNEIAGTSTLVTLVLRNRNAQIPNMRILRLHDDYLVALGEDGKENYFQYAALKEVRMQGGSIAVKPIELPKALVSGSEYGQAAQSAGERAAEIFEVSSGNQALKIEAAVIMIVAGSEDSAQTAKDYLTELAQSNNFDTRLSASLALYRAGAAISPGVIVEGIHAGGPMARQAAVVLAGLTGDHSMDHVLYRMLQDRSADYCAPAAVALALLGERDAIPTMLSMLVDKNLVKAEAAKFALIHLGGDDILEQMKMMLDNAEGLGRYRIAEVLFRLGDPMGKTLLRDEMMSLPSLQLDAAILLASGGDTRAGEFLRDRLGRRFEPTPEDLINRARMAAALFQSGDRTMLGLLMELGRSELPAVQLAVYTLAGEMGERSLVSAVRPGIEESNPLLSLSACNAAVALLDPEYRERMQLASAR